MPEILIVDDDESILLVYKEVFLQNGFGVTTAESGHEGAKLVSEQAFDLIILDMMMPGISGIELTAIIKSNILNCNTPIFMVSGNFDSKNLKLIKELGLVRIVEKPPVMRKLLEDVVATIHPNWHLAAYSPVIESLFEGASKSTLKHYFDDKLSWKHHEIDKTGKAPHVFCSTVALFGQMVYGSISLSCDEGLIKFLARQLFGDKNVESSNLYPSIIGEVNNLLAGEVRRRLQAKGVESIIGLPEISVGSSRLPHKVSSPSLHMPACTPDGDQLVVAFCLGDPKKIKSHPVPAGFEVFLYD